MTDHPTHKLSGRNAFLIIGVLGTINLVNQMDRVLFALMVEPIKADLNLSDTQMGLLGGVAFAACYAIMGLGVGHIADRWNRVSLIGIALTVWSAATAACGLAQNFVQMFASRMLVGTGEAGCVPSAQSLISDMAPARSRAFLLSAFTGVGMVGTLIGLILGGVVLQMVGWRMTFVVFGLFGLIPLAILFLTMRDPRKNTATKVVSGHRWTEDALSMLKRREIQLLLIATPLLYTLAGAATWIPAFFQRSYGITTEEFSRIGGASLGIGLILGTFAGGIIVNKLLARDARWEFWWSSLACTLSLIPLSAVYLGTDLNTAYIALFAAFFIAGSSFGPSMAAMHTVAKQSVRATVVAAMMFATSLIAYGAIPAVIGFLSDVFANNGASIADGTSLKYALVATMALPPVASILFLATARIAFPTHELQPAAHKA